MRQQTQNPTGQACEIQRKDLKQAAPQFGFSFLLFLLKIAMWTSVVFSGGFIVKSFSWAYCFAVCVCDGRLQGVMTSHNARISKYLQTRGRGVHTLSQNEWRECVSFRAHLITGNQTNKTKTANSDFRSDSETKILNFISVSKSIVLTLVCTPGDQTPFKFTLLI